MTLRAKDYQPKRLGTDKRKKQKYYRLTDWEALTKFGAKHGTSFSQVLVAVCQLYIDKVVTKIEAAHSAGDLIHVQFLPRNGGAKRDYAKHQAEAFYRIAHIERLDKCAEKLVRLGVHKKVTFSGMIDAAIALYLKEVVNK